MIPNRMDDFDGLKTSVEEVNAGKIRDLELKMESEEIVKQLQSHKKKCLIHMELLLKSKQTNKSQTNENLLEMECNPAKDAE